jgi:DNA polymerase III delta subunit
VALLKPEAFLHLASKNRLAAVYLFIGDDIEAIDRAVEAVEGTVDEADRAFAVERRYAGEAGGQPLDIISSARMVPMLGDKRVVVVLRAERLLKPKRAGGASDDDDEVEADTKGDTAPAVVDAGVIEEYLDDPVPSTTLVFVATEVDRSRRLTKRLIDKADVVSFVGLTADPRDPRELQRQAATVVETTFSDTGHKIDADAIRVLVSRTGGDVTKLRHDAAKLALFVGARKRITLDDVVEVVSDPNTTDDDWAVVNAISAGDAARALKETGRRLDRGDSVHALVGQLRWWVSNRLKDSEPGRVKPALSALLRTDLALKSSGGDERVLVERLVVELTK